MLFRKCAVFDRTISRLNKKQEASELLSDSILKTPFTKIPPLGHVLFWRYKMNEIANDFLLTRGPFTLEMRFKQPGIAYRACGPFSKNKGGIRKFEETGDFKIHLLKRTR